MLTSRSLKFLLALLACCGCQGEPVSQKAEGLSHSGSALGGQAIEELGLERNKYVEDPAVRDEVAFFCMQEQKTHILFPLGQAEERVFLTLRAMSPSDDSSMVAGFISLHKRGNGKPSYAWDAPLYRTKSKASDSMGSIERWLADRGYVIADDAPQDARDLVRTKQAYAYYFFELFNDAVQQGVIESTGKLSTLERVRVPGDARNWPHIDGSYPISNLEISLLKSKG